MTVLDAGHHLANANDDSQNARSGSATINSAMLRSNDNVISNDYSVSEMGIATSEQMQSSNVCKQ